MRDIVSSPRDTPAAPNRATRRKHRVILRKRIVAERVGLSESQVWRKATNPNDDFPEMVQLGPNSVGFYENEIQDWIDSRPRGGAPWKPELREHQRAQGARQPEPEAA